MQETDLGAHPEGAPLSMIAPRNSPRFLTAFPLPATSSDPIAIAPADSPNTLVKKHQCCKRIPYRDVSRLTSDLKKQSLLSRAPRQRELYGEPYSDRHRSSQCSVEPTRALLGYRRAQHSEPQCRSSMRQAALERRGIQTSSPYN